MLEVYSVPVSGTRLEYFSYTVSSTAVPGYPPMGFIFIREYPGICHQIKDVISSSEKDRFNNRSCSHMAFTGKIFPEDANGVSMETKSGIHDTTPYSYDLYKVANHRATNLFVSSLSNINLNFPDWTRWGLTLRNISFRVTVIDLLTAECVFSYTQNQSQPIKSRSFVQIHEKKNEFRTSRDGYSWSAWTSFNSTTLSQSNLGLPGHKTLIDCMSETKSLQGMDDNQVLSDLVRRAADDASFTDINSIEFLKDLPQIAQELSLAKDLFLKKKINPQDLASLFLSIKYGTRLTATDAKHYVEDVRRQLWRSISPRAKSARAAERLSFTTRIGEIHSTYHYKIYYDRADAMWKNIASGLLSSGLFPSPKTAWELFPYSFAVDWLLPVSEYLSQSDAAMKWATYAILGSLYSTKTEILNISPALLTPLKGYVGNISAKQYFRSAVVSDQLHHRPVYISTTPGSQFKNYVELGALIVQKLH